MFFDVKESETKLTRSGVNKIGKLNFLKTADISTSPIGVGLEKADAGLYDPSYAYPYLKEIGAKWVRIQSGWHRCERVEGVYEFEWLDSMVDGLLEAGCIPWMCLCYGNSLYDPEAPRGGRCNSRPPIYTQVQRTAWLKYVRATVERYKGKVLYYELWNEPDGLHCWGKGVNGREYSQFAKETARVVKEVDPNCKVIGGSMCNLVRSERFYDENEIGIQFDDNPRVSKFMEEWIDQEVCELIDYVTFHCYIPTPERKMDEVYSEIRKTLDQFNPNIGIIQGETGVHSRFSRQGALNTGEWTEAGQVKYLLRRLITDVSHGAFFASYFTLLDMYENLSEKVTTINKEMYGAYGVLGAEFDENDQPTGGYIVKPSYHALRCISTMMAEGVKVLDDKAIFGRTLNCYWGTPDMDEQALMGNKLTTYTFEKKGGDVFYVYYLAAPILGFDYDGSTSLRLPKPMSRPAVLDMATGDICEIDSEHITEYEGDQVLLRVRMRDYPMAIIDLDDTTLPIQLN